MAGAVALASAAYGVGTQAGGGTATAENGVPRDGAPPGGCERGLRFFGLGPLAEELGVDADELRQALDDFHEQNEGDRRDAFAAALADALGKSSEEVEAALDEVHPGGDGMRHGHHAAPLRGLARALDVTRAELREALREVRTEAADAFTARHAALVAFLADRLGLSEEKVEEAFPEPPALRPHRPGPPGGPPFGP